MKVDDKLIILRQIANCVSENASGEDEQNLLQNFLPLRSYSKLADSKTFLITGGRGTGKTELFRILTSYDGLSHVLSESDKKRYTDLGSMEFITGYITTGTDSRFFPLPNTCSRWIKDKKTEEIYSFWGGLACAAILQKFQEDDEIGMLAAKHLGGEICGILREHSSELSRWWEKLYHIEEKWEHFLSDLDILLKERDLKVFLTYDELDRICTNYTDLFSFVRSLLNFWFIHNSRLTNLKSKIFLRNDLYNAKALQFVDASKMRAYHLELRWDSASLYRMLVKRMANSGEPLVLAYLNDIQGLLQPEKHEKVGYLPEDSEEAFRALTEKMIGQYMGKTPKRGNSYSWVPNHIQDANGELAPRPFLKCFSFAADELLKHRGEVEVLEKQRLFSPTRLQGALTKVSEDRVRELTDEEYHWLRDLIERLRGKTMLMDKREFLQYLNPKCWPGDEQDEVPGENGLEVLSTLVSLGIVMETPGERINVPEIYLYGFGLKRRGGIKRPH